MYIIYMIFTGIILLLGYYSLNQKRKYEKEKILSDKHLEMFLLFDKWIQNEQNGKKIGDYLKKNKVENVILYGMSYIGRRLYKELLKEDIKIKYLIDKNKGMNIDNREINQIDECKDSADIVIVTAIYYFEDLKDELKMKFQCPILSLADIIYKM